MKYNYLLMSFAVLVAIALLQGGPVKAECTYGSGIPNHSCDPMDEFFICIPGEGGPSHEECGGLSDLGQYYCQMLMDTYEACGCCEAYDSGIDARVVSNCRCGYTFP